MREQSITTGHMTLRKTLGVCGFLLVLLAVVLVIASVIGSQRLPLVASLCALAGRSGCGLSSEQRAILFGLRVPRIFLAGAVGMSLAAAGAGYQALLRNPLAEPYLLGISNGAAVGTMVALVFLGANEWSRPVLAFAGALAATFVVYRLARGRAGATPERLILAGVIVTTFQSSAIVFITTLMDATRIRSFTFWLLGDLSGTTTNLLAIAFVAAGVGVGVLALNARSLNLMMLGERDAFDLGVEVGRVRLTVFIAASLLVGASVASSGSRSEEHTSELQSRSDLVCRLLLEKKKKRTRGQLGRRFFTAFNCVRASGINRISSFFFF